MRELVVCNCTIILYNNVVIVRLLVSLAPTIVNITTEIVTPHLPRYHSEGFVIFNEKGEVGKLCTENLNQTIFENNTAEILHNVASSLCKSLSYQYVKILIFIQM